MLMQFVCTFGTTEEPTTHGPGYTGLMATAWVWVLKYPYCHQMITQTHPRGERRVSEKVECKKILRCH